MAGRRCRPASAAFDAQRQFLRSSLNIYGELGRNPLFGTNTVRRIAIIQGHPDPPSNHLLHAMADAYADGAASAGHDLRQIEVAQLEFPLLRTQVDFETGALPPALVQPSDDLRWAQHWVFCFRSGMEPCLPNPAPGSVSSAELYA
jgi:hypothetical protein